MKPGDGQCRAARWRWRRRCSRRAHCPSWRKAIIQPPRSSPTISATRRRRLGAADLAARSARVARSRPARTSFRASATKPALVLLVDQFEELFAAGSERSASARPLPRACSTRRDRAGLGGGDVARRPLRAAARAAGVEGSEGNGREPRSRPARASRTRRNRARAGRGGRPGVRVGCREGRSRRAAAGRRQERRQPAVAAVHAAPALRAARGSRRQGPADPRGL